MPLDSHQHVLDSGGPASLAALERGRGKPPHCQAALFQVLALFTPPPHPSICSAHILAASGPLLRPALWQALRPTSRLALRPTSVPSLVLVGRSLCGLPTAHILFHGPGLLLSRAPGREGETCSIHPLRPGPGRQLVKWPL